MVHVAHFLLMLNLASQYDITEEATGEPHCLAMQHIYMYVNETHDPFPTIHALYDPEGYVHYLFGIEFDGDKDTYREAMNRLSEKNQQGEFEVFVYYGEVSYEWKVFCNY